MADEENEPALTGLDEKAMLGGWLDRHRAVLLRKCNGLTDAQLREATVEPSPLNLLGLLRHMSDNENWWFRVVMVNEQPAVEEWTATDDDPDSDLLPPPDATLAQAIPLFRSACARSREITAGWPSLDVEGDLRGKPVSARWVLTHMVEEYARHNGHADLLRERIDGETG